MPTLIQGKDAPAEETLARFKKLAAALHLNLIEKDYLNPVPNLHSLHLEQKDCPQIYSNGKGATYEAALCSAYGEMFERLATFNFCNEYFLGEDAASDEYLYAPDERWIPIPEDEDDDMPLAKRKLSLDEEFLTPKLRAFYLKDVSNLASLAEIGSSSYKRGVCCLPFISLTTGESVYFPVHLLDDIYGSNGMSAGNTEPEALVQALSEIIERYVKNQIISKAISLPEVPAEIIAEYPKIKESLESLNQGQIVCRVYDASLGGRFPVICAVLFNQSNATACASFGSHPMLEVALERTLTELMQGRTFGDLDNFEKLSLFEEEYADPTNLVSHFIDSSGILPLKMFKDEADHNFVHWNFSGSTSEQFAALCGIIQNLGFDIYLRRYANLGVPVVRVIIPGMSEIYPIDDLEYNSSTEFIAYQESILALPETEDDPQAFADYLDELEAETNLSDEMPVKTMLGILPDEGSAWEILRVCDLKFILALKACDYDKACDYASLAEKIHSGDLSLQRRKLYQCVIDLLLIAGKGLDEKSFSKMLSDLYGADTLQEAKDLISNKSSLFGLKASDLSLKNFKKHRILIDIFKRIRDYRRED